MKHLKTLFVLFCMMAMVYVFPTTGNAAEWFGMLSPTGNELYDVWGSSGSDIFAVGERGTILHYNGSSWSAMNSGTVRNLSGVWGISGSDVFAVGEGTILHYNGSSWSAMNSGTTNLLCAIWGSSGSDVFAVGVNDIILHYDGNSWSAMSSGTVVPRDLIGVWGSSGSDVFAVGYQGTILHYNGSSWSAMSSGTVRDLSGVWGSSGSDVFVVGERGTILHYNGNNESVPINFDESVSDQWDSNLESTNRPDRYAKYYTFTLTTATDVQINLESSVDTYMFLLEGDGTDGNVIIEDDDGGNKYNSRITRRLEAGTYTIEATTYSVGRTGEFSLRISEVIYECTMSAIDMDETISGTWSNTCVSTNRTGGQYAQYYTFTLASTTKVKIDLKSSSVDTYMFLLEGDGTDGNVIIQDDDGGHNYNSRITRSLEAGTYTIEATTYSAGQIGDFDLTISDIPTDDCALIDISMGETVDGLLSNTCVSTNRPDRYAHYYIFTLATRANVQIDLESNIDPYLYLMRGNGIDGAVIARNDDGGHLRDARINKWLEAGTYTIEATTYTAGRVGEFSLTIQ